MFHHIAWAMKADTPDALCRWLLVVLADHTNEQGTCFPSQNTLAKRTGMHKATVCRKLLLLENAGLIQRTNGTKGKSTVYKLVVAESDNLVAQCDTKLPVNNKTKRGRVPEDWQPSDELIESINFALSMKQSEVSHDIETDKFRNHHIAKGSRFEDIGRAYRNWCYRSVEYAKQQSTRQTNRGNRNAFSTNKQSDKMRGIISHFADKV